MKNQNGFTIVEGLLILIIAGILGGAGWYVWNAHNKATDSLTNADAANSSAISYTKKTDKESSAKLKEYCSQQEKSCFSYPSNWTVTKSVTSTEGDDDIVTFTSPNGRKLLWTSQVGGIGGACDVKKDPHIYVHEVDEVTNVKGLYAITTGDKQSARNIGLVRSINEKVPQIGDSGLCIFYMTFPSQDNSRSLGLMSGNEWPAVSKPLTDPDLAALKAILFSYHY